MNLPEVSEDFVRDSLPPRKAVSRKGKNGRVLVVGGSPTYHGAPVYAGLAAYRTGIDLVYLAVPKPLADPVRAISPSFIVVPLPDVKLTRGCVRRIERQIARGRLKVDTAVIGPGIGRGRVDEMTSLAGLLVDHGLSLVLDADALQREVLETVSGEDVVVTPHDGEFLRVFGQKVGGELQERVEQTKQEAARLGLTILLKGPIDVISAGSQTMVNRTGNPGMTVGGTGDVLSGIVAALLSKGVKPFEAACVGSWTNGRAGDLAYRDRGLHFIPEDVIGLIPEALKEFDRVE